MAKLEEASFRHRSIRTGAGAIDMHPCGCQVIHPHRVLVQRRFKGGPPRVVTQASQHDFEPVIGEIDARDSLAGRDAQCPHALGYPGFDVHEPVIPRDKMELGQNRAHPAQAKPLPVPVDREMVPVQLVKTRVI